MKVAMITSFFLPYVGGMEYAVYHLSREISKLGVEVDVITPFPRKSMADENMNFKVHRLRPSLKLSKGFFCPPLLAHLLRHDYDIYHLHLPFHFGGETTALCSLIKKTPIIATHHQDWISQNTLLNGAYRIYDEIFTNWILKNAKLITASTNSRAESSPVLKNYREKTVVLRFGVDTDMFYPGCGGAELKLQLALQNKKIVLFVGKLDRQHRYKGLDYLIKAFHGVTKEINNAVLVVVGSGDLLPFYMKMAKGQGLENKVFFMGGVSNEKLSRIYDMCDVFVLPSLNEAYGIVLIEAMACGKPVITTNLPGPAEVVLWGDCGALVEPKNVKELRRKISYLLKNTERSIEIGRRNAEYVRREFEWEKIGTTLKNLYDEVLKVKD
jgi:glycosyltransferase involved in cell wall biosynthesis